MIGVSGSFEIRVLKFPASATGLDGVMSMDEQPIESEPATEGCIIINK